MIPLTPEETERLLRKFPPSDVTLKVENAGNINVRPDNFKMTGDKVYVPVRPGVDLKSFDPELVPSIGAGISPEGARDFTQGPLAYTLTDGKTTKDATVITPQGGSLATYAFREGVYVFYRDGKCYFLWSVDDTGARNYHVAYGTSDSPMGPIKVAEDPIVLVQDGNNEIYGTGHNSVIQIPGRDEWYIVYHRINKKFVNKGPVSTSSYTLNGVRLSGEPRTSGVYVSLDSDGNDRSQGSKLMK